MNRYRVWGSWNWSDSANHWSDTDWGTPWIQFIPTHNDDVFFNSNSSGASYTVTMNVTCACNNMTWANPATWTPTLAWTWELSIFWNLSLVNWMTYTATSVLAFSATSTWKTITSNWVTITWAIQFRWIWWWWILQDAFTTTGFLSVYAGSFDTNNQSLSCNWFSIQSAIYIDKTWAAVARSVILWSSSITSSWSWTMNDSYNTTFNAWTSTITFTWSGANMWWGGKTYYNVIFSWAWSATVWWANTFNNLTRTWTTALTDYLTLADNQTINWTFTANGNSDKARILIRSNALGTQRTITAAAVSCTNADFQDIIWAGAWSWNLSAITWWSGDCWNTSWITFSTPRTLYYHQATAWTDNFSTSAKWWTASNGTWSQATYPPLPQDSLKFDSNSFDTASLWVTQDMARVPAFDFTGVTNSPTFTKTQAASVFWSIKLVSWITLTWNWLYTFEKRWSMTVTSWGKTWWNSFSMTAPTWTVQLLDALDMSTFTLTMSSWTFDTNGQTLSAWTFTGWWWTLTLWASTVNISNGFTRYGTSVTSWTSTINITWWIFSWWWSTYYNVVLTTSSITIWWANTFNNLTCTSELLVSLWADQTVNGTFTCNWPSATDRTLLRTDVRWTQRTLTAATVSVTNTDFQDIVWAWAWSWNLSAWTIWDCWNNSWITFPTWITCYLKTWTSTNFSFAVWYTTSWWSTNSRNPLPQDTARIDNLSITAWSVVLSQDLPRIGTINFTWVTNTPTFSPSATTSVFGSITLASWMSLWTWTAVRTLEWRGTQTITSAWLSWDKPFIVDCAWWSYTLQDAFVTGASRAFIVTSWTFNANNFNFTSWLFYSNAATTRTITMWSGTWELNWTWTVWNTSTFTNLTVNTGTSTVKLTNNSSSSKTVNFWTLSWITLYNFWNATAWTWELTITWWATFNDFKVDAWRTVNFSADSIYTVSSFTCVWSSWSVITLRWSTTWRRIRFKKTSWTINCDYLSLTNVSVTWWATWNAWANSTVWNNCVWWNWVTLPARYWVAWWNWNINDTSNWSASDWGTSWASVPVGNDIYFTANSWSWDVNFNSPINVGAVNCTWFTWTFIGSNWNLWIYGNVTLWSWMTNYCRSNFTFFPTFNDITFTSNGIQMQSNVTFTNVVDTIYLWDDYYNLSWTTLQSGTFDLNDKNSFMFSFTTTWTLTRTINMWSWTMTISGASSSWTASALWGLTVNCETSTIKLVNPVSSLTCSFAWAGYTYYNLLLSPLWTAWISLSGSNIFNDISLTTNPCTIQFTAGTTTTVTTFWVNWTAGNIVTIWSLTNATHTLAKAWWWTITSNYLSISNSIATPSNTWYANNSTDWGWNTWWIFTAPPGWWPNSNMFLFF